MIKMQRLSNKLAWKTHGRIGSRSSVIIITNQTYESEAAMTSPEYRGSGMYFGSDSPSSIMSSGCMSDAGTASTTLTSPIINSTNGLGVNTYNAFGSFLEDVLQADILYKAKAVNLYDTALQLGVCQESDLNKLPLLVLNCLNFLYQYGMNEEAILRLSSSVVVSQTLKQRIIYGGPCISLSIDEIDTHAVVSVLKEFLRSLPDFAAPLDAGFVMDSMASSYESSNGSNTTVNDDPVTDAQGKLRTLSLPKYTLLKCLCRFFNKVAALHTVNRMTAYNIAVTTAPSLNISIDTLKVLIDQYEYVFNDFSDTNIADMEDRTYTLSTATSKLDTIKNSPKSSQAPLEHYAMLFPSEQEYRPGYYRKIDSLVGQKLVNM